MTPALQSKLLRFLEEKTFKRVGGLHDIRVDVRVIAATNRDLEQSVREGKFREDLFYRLQVMPILLPALRERRGDIPLLANYYVDRYNREFKKKVRGISADALRWIEPEDLAMSRAEAPAQFRLPPEGVSLEDVERQLVMQALQRAGGNQTHAGQLLGINRDQVRYRIEKFGLHTEPAK
jgi:transcriptional regulator with PAS, ATPase and Fis domain